MKRILRLSLGACAMFVCGNASAQYQLANGTFDGDFVDCYPWEKGAPVTTAYGKQPEGWCISNVPNSLAKSMASQVEGKNGKAVKITNTAAMGNGIPAYLTLGTTWATAETKMTSTRNKDGGLFGGIAFTKHPDALKFVYTRDGKDKGDESVVLVYSWKGTWTQASVPSNTAVGVLSWGTATKVNMIDRDNNILGRNVLLGGDVTKTADAELIAVGETKITGSQAEWKEVIVPIEYKSGNAPEKINVVFSAAGYQSDASITEGVSITIDDVEFVYNSGLKAQYAGEDITFDENNSAVVAAEYDPINISLISDGQAATIETSYDESACELTITVKGENINEDANNYHVYTIKFGTSSEPQVVETKTYTEKLYASVEDVLDAPVTADVEIETLDNGNINLTLKNFVFNEGSVGNICVKGMELNADGTFAYEGSIGIESGDEEKESEDAMGKISGKVVGDDVLVIFDLNIEGQVINVHYGYDLVDAGFSITDAKYTTFCTPIEAELPEGVKAYICSQIDEKNVLVLEELPTPNIPANTPVILSSENVCEKEYEKAFIEPVKENPTYGLLTGVYTETAAPEDSYVIQQENQKIAFLKVASSDVMVPAYQAYLTVPSSDALAITFPVDIATSINTINALIGGKAEVYDANGARQNGLKKGTNIIKMADGSVQKILVK